VRGKNAQLKKVKKTGEIEQMSGNVRQYIAGNVSVSYLHDNNDRVFMVDSILFLWYWA